MLPSAAVPYTVLPGGIQPGTVGVVLTGGVRGVSGVTTGVVGGVGETTTSATGLVPVPGITVSYMPVSGLYVVVPAPVPGVTGVSTGTNGAWGSVVATCVGPGVTVIVPMSVGSE